MTTRDRIVRLEFCSCLDMLEPVHVVTDQVGRLVGLDEDALHWVNVAVRESVINAVLHGNQNDRRKRVFIDFFSSATNGLAELTILVRDEGQGFDPSALPDPLNPENILKPHGRGVFLMRNSMDEVVLRKIPEGGMEVCLIKRAQR